jgi:hypothetical protein
VQVKNLEPKPPPLRARTLIPLVFLIALLPGRGWGEGPLPVGVTEVEGRAAKALLDRPNATLRVYAFRGGTFALIPFQVDERDRRDHWVDDLGDQPVRDDHPGVFDQNDVVVFMNRDLGTKGDEKMLPPGASAWLEVRVGPPSAPLGYAYVGSFQSPAALPQDLPEYARYDPIHDQVSADRYTLRFGGPLPTYLALGSATGEREDNILNAVYARGEVRILAGLFHFERSEKDLLYAIQGYRQGPVRAIRSAKYWIPLPLGFKARGRVELLFYRDFVEGRTSVNIKIPPRFIPADGEITAHIDFRDFSGARVSGPGGTLDEPIDGRMTEGKRVFAEPPVRWSALLLPSGQTFLLAVRLEDSLQRLDQRLYLDDTTDPLRGKPAFGFRLSGVNRLETGEQELSVNAVILDTISPTDVSAAAGVLLQPPEVTLTPVQGP